MRSPAQDARETRALRGLAAGSILLALGVLFVHGPAQVYEANAEERLHSLPELLITGVEIVAALGLVLAVPLLIRSRRTVRALAVAWFPIAVCLWVSSSFLVLDTGPFDGRATELAVPSKFTLASVAILVAVAVSSALLALRKPGIASFGALTLNLLLLAVTAWYAISRSAAPMAGAKRGLGGFFRFSTTRNVLVVLTDSFQSDLFAEIVAANPKLRGELDGFTYFPDTVGAAASTFVSLPTIHSGRSYDPSKTLGATYERDIRNGSFLVSLASAGFETTLANPLGSKAMPRKASFVTSEVVLGGARAAAREEYGELLDISLFRAAPATLKRLIFNGGAWRTRAWVRDRTAGNRPYRDLRMLATLGERVVVSGDHPTAKFLHTFISHPPVEVDERCLPLAKPRALSRDSMRVQLKCTVEALVELFSVLKQRGTYDGTVIGIVADHGLGLPRPDLSAQPGRTRSWASMEASANPLLLYKPMHEHGPLRDSARAMHIGDLAGMICAETGACGAAFRSGDPDGSGERRRRVFHQYEWSRQYWTNQRISSLKTYAIRGPVWAVRSWSRLRCPELRLDRAASFGTDADAQLLLDWGWGAPEPWGVPTEGPVALLSFGPEKSARARPLRLTAALRRTTALGRVLSVAVEANGRALTVWQLAADAERESFEVDLPSELLRPDDGGVTLQLSVGAADGTSEEATYPSGSYLDLGLESLVLRGI